jgi:hypothetical protein
MSDIPRQAGVSIEVDTECTHCGYNLRGLSREGRCPECGSLIDESLHGDLLRHADPEWLDRLRFGTSLKLWNIAIGLLSGLAGGILLALVALPPVALIAIGLGSSALGLWASFAITTQEPRIALKEDPVTLRKVVRFCAASGFVGSILQNFLTSGNIGTVLYIAGCILALAGVVAVVGELVYFRRFARRIPDGKLERSTTVLLWAVPIAIGLGIVFGVVAGVGAAVGGIGAALVGGFACVGGVAALVFLIWYLRVLTQYKTAFASAAAESRASTATAPAEPGPLDSPPNA